MVEHCKKCMMSFDNEKFIKINKVLCVVIMLTVAFNIVFLMRYNFEADSAFYITLAQEQIRTKSLFPEGMYYSTGLFFLTPNLLMIPFLLFIDNLILARQMGILLLWVLIFFMLYKVFVTNKERNVVGFIIAFSLFSVLYVNASVVNMHFYQGAYCMFLFLLLAYLALMNDIITGDNYRKKEFAYVILLYVLANIGDIRSLFIWGIPGLFSYILYVYLKSKKSMSLVQVPPNWKKLVWIMLSATLIALVTWMIVSKVYGTGNVTSKLTILPAKEYGNSLYSILIGLLNQYGNSYRAYVFSTAGFWRVVNFAVALFFILILPVIAIKTYNNICFESGKFLVVFSLVSNMVYIFVVFLTGLVLRDDIFGYCYLNRYLIPVYNNNILLFSVILSSALNKNLKKYLGFGVFCVLYYVCLNNCFFLNCQRDSIIEGKFGTFAEGVEGVYEFLEDKGLYYGYATFFNAEEYSILSNNMVRIRGVRFVEDGIASVNWLTSTTYYDPKYFVGRTFLMLADNDSFPEVNINNVLGKPAEILRYKKFTIFVYNYNISCHFVKSSKTGPGTLAPAKNL